MCGHFGQNTRRTERWQKEMGKHINANLKATEWIESPELIEEEKGTEIKDNSIIGIGDYATILYYGEENYWLDWAKFSSQREVRGKKTTYFNARIEKLEQYHQYTDYERANQKEEIDQTFTDKVVIDLQERPCAILVDHFFEKDKSINNTGYYMIEREDQRLFALAAFFTPEFNEKGEFHQAAFTIITRDPYKGVIKHTGHDRSPVLISLKDMDNWLDPSIPFLDKLPLLAKQPQGNFRIWPVESSIVTKRMKSMLEPNGQFIITNL